MQCLAAGASQTAPPGRLLREARALLVCAGLVLAGWQPPGAHAAVVIANLPVATNGGSSVSATSWKALVFTTGSSATRIDRVVLGLNPLFQINVPSQAKVEIALFGSAANVPTVQLATTGLQDVSIQQLQQTYEFPIASGFNLAANTQYALVIRSDGSAIKWGNTAGSQPTASGGFTYNAFAGSADSGATWTSLGVNTENALQLSVTAPTPTPVPALSGWALAAFGLLLAGAGVRLNRPRRG